MQEPLAKLVSKSLKPVLERSPMIMKGSKDLAQKLQRIKQLKPGRMVYICNLVYICTGDIVAYYPNLPQDAGIKLARKEWLAHRHSVWDTITDPWLTLLHCGNRNHQISILEITKFPRLTYE